MLDKCIYCGEDIYPDDESCSNYIGQSHIECAEREDPEELN
jgi:predicted nucleic acid-binding Zn ribbon protein